MSTNTGTHVRNKVSRMKEYHKRVKYGYCLVENCGGALFPARSSVGTAICYCERCSTNHFVDDDGTATIIPIRK